MNVVLANRRIGNLRKPGCQGNFIVAWTIDIDKNGEDEEMGNLSFDICN